MVVGDRVAALVLAGGQARRMGGGDKALLKVGGRTMLQAVIDALGIQPLAISANGDRKRFAGFGVPVLDDGDFMDQGPLAGVLAGLEWASGLGMATLVTAAGDMPFLPAGLAERLRPAPAAAASGGRRHPLVAQWPVTVAPRLRSWLVGGGSRRVTDFAERINMRYLEFAVRAVDPFANVNSPSELDLARLWVDRLPAGASTRGGTGL